MEQKYKVFVEQQADRQTCFRSNGRNAAEGTVKTKDTSVQRRAPSALPAAAACCHSDSAEEM